MIELFIALGAGLISFLSPCVLPLIPGYISFISGQSLNELVERKKINLVPLFLFSLGFSFVFIIFGATASVLGKLLLQNSDQLRIIAGLIIIIFSLQLLGVINIKFLNYEKKMQAGNTKNMIFNTNFLLSYLSKFMSLQPGDIVTTGTPAGVGMGMKPPVFLKPGDKIKLSIDNLGEQNSKVITE